MLYKEIAKLSPALRQFQLALGTRGYKKGVVYYTVTLTYVRVQLVWLTRQSVFELTQSFPKPPYSYDAHLASGRLCLFTQSLGRGTVFYINDYICQY